MKQCTKCMAEKPFSAFYTTRGRLTARCRECTKMLVRERYERERDKIAAYERARAKDPQRRKSRVAYLRDLRSRDPLRAKAWNAVSNALRDGRLSRLPCEVCGATERVQAHHDDYARPLDVRWLCFRHHREHEHGQTTTKEVA